MCSSSVRTTLESSTTRTLILFSLSIRNRSYKPLNDFQQIALIKTALDDVRASADIDAVFAFVARFQCRHEDHGHFGQPLVGTDPRSQIKSVHARHFDVGYNQIKLILAQDGKRIHAVHGG